MPARIGIYDFDASLKYIRITSAVKVKKVAEQRNTRVVQVKRVEDLEIAGGLPAVKNTCIFSGNRLKTVVKEKNWVEFRCALVAVILLVQIAELYTWHETENSEIIRVFLKSI